MIKSFTFSFDFNTETETITNVKHISSTEKKKSTTKPASKTSLPNIDSSEPLIIREDNRLVINNKTLELLGIDGEEDVRLSVGYAKEGKKLIPVISVDEKGNKLSKNNTLPFRGKQNEVLEEFGTEFKVIVYEEGQYKLIQNTEDDPSVELTDEVITELNEDKPFDLELDLLTETDEIYNIDEMKFTL